MLKTLIKKQLAEEFAFIFLDRRKNLYRKGGSAVLYALLYLFIFAVAGANIYFIASTVCGPLVKLGCGWLYFALFGLIAILFGLFGSIFATYNSLYVSKDNDMLFSLPIEPRYILFSRMIGVYLLGFVYTLIVALPMLIAYFVHGAPTVPSVLLSPLVPFLLSLAVFSLSCLLGRALAGVLTRIRNKTAVTLVISLLFIALYMFVYMRANDVLQKLMLDPTPASNAMRNYVYPLYRLGLGATGSLSSMLISIALFGGFAALVYLFVAHGFSKLVISGSSAAVNVKKEHYSEKSLRAGSALGALYKKEFARFFSSANYMLNSGIGAVMMVIASGFLFIKGRSILQALPIDRGLVTAIACGAVLMTGSLITYTAPSVSLEGKQIYILQSLPVPARDVLRAKLLVHLTIALPPLVLLLAAIEYAIEPEGALALLLPAASLSFAVFMAIFALVMNLKMPNLSWTNEVVPIKQSMPVFIVVMLSMILPVLFVLGSMAFKGHYALFLGILTAVFAVLSALLLRWTDTRGAKIFSELH